ncbi:hypothetical protein PybrP1_009175, partial [[Pythium] brassicae (nom. inval.)]
MATAHVAHRDADSDGNGDGPGASASATTIASSRATYPLNVAVDFTQLRTNALRRYLAFHCLPEVPGSSREQLAVAVARHFNDACQRSDERSSIASFVGYLTSMKAERDANTHSESERRPRESDEADSNEEEEEEEEPEPDGGYDCYPDELEEDGERADDALDNEHSTRWQHDAYARRATFGPLKRKSSSSESSSDAKSGRMAFEKSGGGTKGGADPSAKKKKRKARLYCVCKGASFGNMIACDSRTCLDRSNWYHMGCVGLAPSEDPPETWFCPTCQEQDLSELPENQYRKPVASVTYGDMISHALTVLPQGKGSFKEICDFVEKQYESQLNWKLESDQRKSPVWKSSVRKILFSNMRFRKHPDDKGLFCLA